MKGRYGGRAKTALVWAREKRELKNASGMGLEGADHAARVGDIAAPGKGGVDDADEVHEPGDGDEKGAKFVHSAHAANVRRIGGADSLTTGEDGPGCAGRVGTDGDRAGGGGVAVFGGSRRADDGLGDRAGGERLDDLEEFGMGEVGGKGDRPVECLAQEPDAVLTTIDAGDATDKQASEEEEQDASADSGGAGVVAEVPMARARKGKGGKCGDGLEGVFVVHERAGARKAARDERTRREREQFWGAYAGPSVPRLEERLQGGLFRRGKRAYKGSLRTALEPHSGNRGG